MSQFRVIYLILFSFISLNTSKGQNSIVGDGFGGRLWYKPCNFSTGGNAGLAICGDSGQLYTWGDYRGYGSYPTAWSNRRPQALKDLDHVYQAVNNFGTIGVVKTDASGWIWGNNCQNNTNYYHDSIATKVIDEVRFVDVGENWCSFIKRDSTVWCIGKEHYGGFGTGTQAQGDCRTLHKMKGIRNAVRVACGSVNTFVLLANGRVMSVGNSYWGSLGLGKPDGYMQDTPSLLPGLQNIVDIKAGVLNGVALDNQGRVFVWGAGQFGGIGDGSFNHSSIPKQVKGLKDIVAISGKGYHFLALDKDYNCYYWGVSDAQVAPLWEPTPVLIDTGIIDIMAANSFTYILRRNGALMARGYHVFPIWLNLMQQSRNQLVELVPSAPGIGICQPYLRESKLTDVHIPSDTVTADTFVRHLKLYNVFTPNNDGMNDVFEISGDPGITYDLFIYNRWGELVFQTKQSTIGNKSKFWNGQVKNNGAQCPGGTYYYLFYPGGSDKKIGGIVQLLR